MTLTMADLEWLRKADAPARLAPPPPTCEHCTHFQPDPINPPAGAGYCASGHGIHYPGERHRCADHQVSK